MEIGEHCNLESCSTLTYLPVKCSYCRGNFCQSHFLALQHDCKAPGAAESDRILSEAEIIERVQKANERRKQVQQGVASGINDESQQGPSKLPCQRAGCKNYSLELDPVTSKESKTGQKEQQAKVIHAAPRCDRCHGFFCMRWVSSCRIQLSTPLKLEFRRHRSAVSHGCTAPAPPTIGDKRRDAANERKQKAQDILNKHFPNRSKKWQMAMMPLYKFMCSCTACSIM